MLARPVETVIKLDLDFIYCKIVTNDVDGYIQMVDAWLRVVSCLNEVDWLSESMDGDWKFIVMVILIDKPWFSELLLITFTENISTDHWHV